MARGKGEGSIFKMATGYWCGSVENGRYPTGGRRKARIVRRTRREVVAEIAKLKAQTQSAADHNRTVAGYLAFWLDEVIAGEVSADTLKEYRTRIARVTPVIGHHRLAKLNKAHVQQLAAVLAERYPRSPRTRASTLVLLRSALRWAVPDLIPHNPAEGVKGPKSAKGDVDDTLTASQAKAVLAAAEDSHGEAMIWLAVTYGLRLGELLGLRWSDIADDELTVRRSTTKSDAGHRTVPLLPEAKAMLAKHRRSQRVTALDGAVFLSQHGRPASRTSAYRYWNAVLVKAGIPHLCRNCGSDEPCSTSIRRFHSSRHTAATLLLEAGVPLEVVSAILGHANIQITADIYAKVRADLKRKGLDRLG